MPLVRYEVRCEHSLGDPELFRSAGLDDPEGLLQGVAMAGLTGIVRQLGDLAEYAARTSSPSKVERFSCLFRGLVLLSARFAAEVFCDLHKELTFVGGRARDLTVRVQQLEAGLPAAEKALLSEPNQLRFAYTNGVSWRASMPSDQNHCTSRELPRFVRKYYEECREPPRLFVLDKFDVAGPGACLKRFSDPSFFKVEWARSELIRAQRDEKARQDKKKGRRRKAGHLSVAMNQIPARVRYGSASIEDLNSPSPLLAPTLTSEVGPTSSKCGDGTGTRGRSSICPLQQVVEGLSSAEGASSSDKDIKTDVPGKLHQSHENVAERMDDRISKIIEREDREAVPPVGLIPRNVGNNCLKQTSSSVDAKEVRFSRLNSENSTRGANDVGNGTAVSTSERFNGLTEQGTGTSEAVDRQENSYLSATFTPTGNPSPCQDDRSTTPDVGHGVAETPGGDGGTADVASRNKPALHYPTEAVRRPSDAVDTDEVSNSLEEAVPHLPPIRVNEEEPQIISAASPSISSQWSSPGEDGVGPSVSMLSRLSYSSELMPFSSCSEPESPVSPSSPAFNALYFPPGPPSRISGLKNESPRGLHVGSCLQAAPHSGSSSLSTSSKSRLVSSWTDNAGPSRPPPLLLEESSYFENRQDINYVEAQPSPQPNPELYLLDGLLSQSTDGRITNRQENGGETVPPEPASQRSENQDTLHFEASSRHVAQEQPLVAYSEAQNRPPSTASTSATEPLRSALRSSSRLTNSATMQPFHKSSDTLNPQLSVEVPSNGPATDLIYSPGRKFEAVSVPAPSQEPTSSEISMHPTLRPLKRAMKIVALSFSEGGEENVPSSPTGSVIIKDTPSPPASPASNYSESGSEIHEHHSSHDQSRSSMSPR